MQPRAKWSSQTVKVGELATFDFNVGGLDATVSGPGAPTRNYTSDKPAYTARTKFTQPGTVTWTVTNSDGSAEATITVVE